jgi:hypothetical protein
MSHKIEKPTPPKPYIVDHSPIAGGMPLVFLFAAIGFVLLSILERCIK